MKMIHPDEIRREFDHLVGLVDPPQLKQLPEGLWTRSNEAEIWLSMARLARLVYVNAMMAGSLKTAFENLMWGLARLEVRTADETSPNIPSGSPIVFNRHEWDEARAAFSKSLSTWPLQ